MPKEYISNLYRSFLSPKFFWLVMAACSIVLVFNYFFLIGVNFSESLPFRFYIVSKLQNGNIKNGDLIAFRYNNTMFFPRGELFVKYVAGTSFDTVDVIGIDFFINPDGDRTKQKHVGAAKLFSGYEQEKDPLLQSEGGMIPPGKLYVYSPYPHSFDSRYTYIGLLDTNLVVGKVIWTWGDGNYDVQKNGEVVEKPSSSFYAKK